MYVVYLILAIIWVLLYTHNHIYWNANYNKVGGKAPMLNKILGGIVAAIINGIAWWYIIECLIRN